jgi:ABC-type transport system involved in cytochrome bd biosynthesis fused ATPase/permease subunit
LPQAAAATELADLTVPQPLRPLHSWRTIGIAVLGDLKAAGVSKFELVRETSLGVCAEGLRWFSHFALVAMGLEAATTQSSSALLWIGVWAACSTGAAVADRFWRTKANEFDRAFGRALHARLLSGVGGADLRALDSQEYQANVELHYSRVSTISNLVEMSISFPHHVTRLALSGGLLFMTDWRVGLALIIAVAPGIWLKSRHTAEDLKLEELQSGKRKIADTIQDEGYHPNGSVRMKLTRATDQIVGTIVKLQTALDREKDVHERRQALKEGVADSIFYATLAGSMVQLFSQYQAEAIGIGVLGFLWLQLIDLGTDLDEQGAKLQEYLDLSAKTKSFYSFENNTESRRAREFPQEYSLRLKDPLFRRGEDDAAFTVTLPSFELLPGDFMVVHGGSGAGKTTAQRHMAFAAKPTSGELLIGDTPAHLIEPEAWLQSIGYCGAVDALLQGLSIREALTLDPEGAQFLTERLKHPLISELIEKLSWGKGIETRIGMGIEDGREFSTGELTRLMLVPALVPRRKILFLDEVTSNQSDDFVRTVMTEIEAQRALGTIVVFVTHSKRFDEAASHILQVSKGVATLEKEARNPAPA